MAENDIEEIKNRLDIAEVIQEYIPLKKAGTNYRANCPFHNEKTPSFMVSKEKQIWHCFGCGEGGDIFGFIQRMEGVEFPEALRILAEKAGVELKRRDPALQNQKTRMLDACRWAGLYYRKVLLESPQADSCRNYLKSRGLDDETADEFKIGYSPETWDAVNNFLKKKGYTEEEIFLAGLTVKKEKGYGYYDRFRGRLMFPINDANGAVVGFGGRTLKTGEDKGAKYINSPQTLAYNKSQILYGLDKAKNAIRKQDQVIVVEGYMDCVTAHQYGITNVVASSGTALTDGQVQLLKRFTDNIAMCFDPDTAGKEAAKRGIEVALGREMNIKVVELPVGKDPDVFIKESKDGFLAIVVNAKSYLEYYFDSTLKQLDVKRVEGKKQAARILLPVISKIGDTIEQAHWTHELAGLIGVDEKILWEKMQSSRAAKTGHSEKAANFTAKPINRFLKIGDELLSLLIKYPEYMDFTGKILDCDDFTDNAQAELYKNMIVYYTDNDTFKQENFLNLRKTREGQANGDSNTKNLSTYLDILQLLGEENFADLKEKEARQNLNERALMLKKNSIFSQLKTIESEIKVLETKKPILNQKEFDTLSEKFNQLTNKLHQLNNN